MKNHEIKIEDLSEFDFEYHFASEAKAGKGTKRLIIYVNLKNEYISYIVYRNSELLINTIHKKQAIEEYNKIKL